MTTTTTTSAPPTTTTFPIFTEATLDGKAPQGPIEQIWDQTRFNMKLVNPSNRRKFNIIIVGSGLAGAAAAASLGEQGYNVECYAYQDSPRRAHSVAAQGGINAAKNYRNDGDSIYRLFYDTVKGGDFRAREANVYRLAQVSNAIIDQCVAQGVPLPGNTAGCWTTAPLAAPRFRAPSTPGDRPVSSSCSAPTRRWRGRLQPRRSRCTTAAR
jgi:succinate dehydrogenase / fumarate reductase flavoprotein subunit